MLSKLSTGAGALIKGEIGSVKNPDAILLTQNDVLNLRLNKIENHNDKYEMWDA